MKGTRTIITGMALVLALAVASAAASYAADFSLASPAISGSAEVGFDSGLSSAGRIDAQYAAKADGPANSKSFPFTWSNVPAGTKALALIFDDPDARLVLLSRGIKAPAFLHWTAADIDPSLGGLPSDASQSPSFTFVQGKNGGGQVGYRGPQPPADFPPNMGKRLIHIYRLSVFALSAPTGLKNGYSVDELRQAMQGKVIGEARLNISYSND